MNTWIREQHASMSQAAMAILGGGGCNSGKKSDGQRWRKGYGRKGGLSRHGQTCLCLLHIFAGRGGSNQAGKEEEWALRGHDGVKVTGRRWWETLKRQPVLHGDKGVEEMVVTAVDEGSRQVGWALLQLPLSPWFQHLHRGIAFH